MWFQVRTVARMTAMTYDIQSLLFVGGFGFLPCRHGLVIDNLLQVCHSHLPDRVAVS
jgi:hypothetical protein